MSISDDQVHVSLETADDGVVVLRKRATGPGSGRRLTREGALLEAAHHPGIVQVLRRSGSGATTELDLSWAGPRSLASQPRLPSSEVAGLATSLATTVADLHDLGIVHGRIVPEHVLVGVDGRPVLCGFGDAVMSGIDGGCGAAPGDDVAAIGTLIAWLAGTESEVEPIPEHRWWRGRRWDGYHRRALLNLADHARDAAPDRRPSARALADAITTAVPSARLPVDRSPVITVPSADATAGREAAQPRATRPGLSTPPRAPRPVGRAREPETITARRLHEPTPASEHPADRPEPPRPGSSAPERPSGRRATSRRPTSSTGRGDRAPVSAGATPLPVADSRATTDESQEPTASSAGWDEPPLRRGPQHRPRPSTNDHTAEPADRVRNRTDRGPVDAALDAVEGRAVSTRRRLALGGVAAGLALVSALAVGVLADGGDEAQSELPSSAPSAEGATRRAGAPRCPTVVGPRADADGDGCAELVVADGRRVRVGDRSFVVGESGDRVTIGDWDCDGTATPAVLRLGTGAIYTFAGWPARGALPRATLVASVERATDIDVRSGPAPGCPVLVVDRRGQPTRVLDLGAGR